MLTETNLHVKCYLEIYIVYGVEKIDMRGGLRVSESREGIERVRKQSERETERLRERKRIVGEKRLKLHVPLFHFFYLSGVHQHSHVFSW